MLPRAPQNACSVVVGCSRRAYHDSSSGCQLCWRNLKIDSCMPRLSKQLEFGLGEEQRHFYNVPIHMRVKFCTSGKAHQAIPDDLQTSGFWRIQAAVADPPCGAN